MKSLPVLALCAAAFVGLPTLLTASPASAQETIDQKIIFGNDPCPKSEGNTIVVCARLPENDRYRIPPDLRHSNNPANTSWTARVRSYEAVGKFGPMSCTPVGAGGDLGCTEKMIAKAYAEKEHGESIRMSELIAEARKKRLEKINSEAAATQARVKKLEQAYEDRVAREENKPLPSQQEVNPGAKVQVVETAATAKGNLPPPDFSQGQGAGNTASGSGASTGAKGASGNADATSGSTGKKGSDSGSGGK